MKKTREIALTALLCAAPMVLTTPLYGQDATGSGDNKIRRVLVISIDGMHSLDLALWVKNHPGSALAQLAAQGMDYTNASTTKPSDSIPSTVGIFTGGTPAVGGMYYDDAFNRAWFPPGSNCTATPGAVIDLKQGINLALDGSTGVDPAKLPLQLVGGICTPVLPHNMLRVNTVFEVIHAAGQRTAYSEKRPAYEFLNGPSGTGIDDLYTPEIACFPYTPPSTCVNALLTIANTKAFDDVRVASVINEIKGLDHSGTVTVGVPAIFGMNFQAINSAKKTDAIPSDDVSNRGGYKDDLSTPNSLLNDVLTHTDASIGQIVAALDAQGLTNTTAIIITAKHGETALDPTERATVSTNAIQGVLTAAGIPPAQVAKLTQKSTGLIWLKNQAQTATAAAALTTLAAETSLHTAQTLSGESLKLLFPDPLSDPAPPDVVVVPFSGVNYEPTSGTPVHAEHGGFNENDLHVPLLVVHSSLPKGLSRAPVTTTQIAPTLLALLGLDQNRLQAVQLEGTPLLPGLLVKSDNGNSSH